MGKMAVLRYLSDAFQVTQRVPVVARLVDVSLSTAASLLRGFSGIFVAQGVESCPRPAKMLRLYDFEACPFCRKVRETLTALDLDVEVRPCPKETLKIQGYAGEKSRFRHEVTKEGGQMTFPFLVDENTGVRMNGSDEINEYLWKTYGANAKPDLTYRLGQKLNKPPFLMLPALARPCLSHGVLVVPSKAPAQPLELWGCEGSPFVRFVREALCVLQLPYVLRNVAHGSAAKRAEFHQRFGERLSVARRAAGAVQMPLLLDPNTGAELLESADIVKYLFSTYQDGPPSSETWLDANFSSATKKD